MPGSVADNGGTRVATASQIPEESAVSVWVAHRPVRLVRSRGRLSAVLDECSHGEVALSGREVANGTIKCWLHGSRFDLTTGRPAVDPAGAHLSHARGRRRRLRQRRQPVSGKATT